ncbi:MAG TPA: site-specific integrase [Bacteroides sp.]|nr:site-specific integrase [Bacteroides sp.]
MATAKIVLYESKKLSKGKYPIMLRITSQRARKYVSLGYSATSQEWEKLRNPDNNSKLAKLIRKRQADADKIIDRYEYDGHEFTVEQFYNEWTRRQKGTMTVFKFFDERIQYYKKKNRPGNAAVYTTAKNYLSKYRKEKDLRFSDITPQLLKKFKDYLEDEIGISGNTISIYMRTLRAVFNSAMEEGHVSRDTYPFGKGRFNISQLSEETAKRALTKEEMQKINSQDFNEHPELIDARNIFMFSFFVRGIQFFDIVHLTWDHVQGDRLIYRRRKTGVYFNVKIQPDTRKIIDYCKSQNIGSDFIFPVLDHRIHKTEQQKFDRINKKRKQVNKKLKLIGLLADVEKPFTSYWARHTYASIQKFNGIPAGMIRELLGHSTEKVTQIYLDKFGNEMLDKLDENLI